MPLNSAPTIQIVNSRLREIYELAKKGRAAKGRNLWSAEWESGVASFVDAFDKLSSLKAELEDYYYKYERLQHDNDERMRSRKSTILAIWGIVATVITFILAAILAWR